MSILIGIFTLLLILVALFLVLVVLAQKTKDGGMGAALGGGATESAFGHETGNVLTNATIYAAVLFFVLSFVLYLAQIYESKHQGASGGTLPVIAVPAALPVPIPATPPGTTAAPAGSATEPNFKITLPEPVANPTPVAVPAAGQTPPPAATTAAPKPAATP
jgi:preprotein translocase subunit SecG